MSEAFDLYKFTAPSEMSKREYHAKSSLKEDEWPRQKFLDMKALINIDILTSECLRDDPHYFAESKEDKRIELIPTVDIDALYGWINKFDRDDIKENPAFYHGVTMEINRRRNGHL